MVEAPAEQRKPRVQRYRLDQEGGSPTAVLPGKAAWDPEAMRGPPAIAGELVLLRREWVDGRHGARPIGAREGDRCG
ncbi:hypothetical protein NDU88_004399 [Pleurodeles waltl]|uniref:Uncharacterized protein n=1 Tax=Pleurodeles waltl TaxID=8319 RepID=A0AAV7KZT8_PLEWA|nr:hypothetical protein NDU88_004399 [Pleurodeles waltl]